MSLTDAQIRQQFQDFAGRFGPGAIFPAIVTAVNVDDTISISLPEGGEVEDCRLKAVIKDGNAFVLVPTVGSNVIVGRIENSDEFVVLAVSEITEIKQNISDSAFEHNEDGFIIRKGGDNLREIFELIISAVQVITVVQGNNPDRAKLQQALQKVKNLLRNAT